MLEVINFNLNKNYRITTILRALKISRSTYYDWQNWTTSKQEKRHQRLRKLVVKIWKTNYKVYGYLRIAAVIRSLGIKISDRLTWKLMKECGIKSHMNKRYKKPTTQTEYDQRPNLAHLSSNGDVLYTDITYIQLINRKWVYLASVFDAKTRKVVSYSISKNMTS